MVSGTRRSPEASPTPLARRSGCCCLGLGSGALIWAAVLLSAACAPQQAPALFSQMGGEFGLVLASAWMART